MRLDPFMLQPEYREYIWGGKRIRPAANRTAEAWLVYEQDVILDGVLKGMTLAEAADQEGSILLGDYVFDRTGSRFPLLIKLLDCADWLSLQVHPNNLQAEYWEGPGHFGKTEGWYIIEADAGSELISGFKPGTTESGIKRAVGTSDLLDIVGRKAVEKRDALLILPGNLHALGPGLLVYEVQQTSDLTYRVYDWDRPMKDGRQLHIEQAADVLDPAIDGNIIKPSKTPLLDQKLIACEFFDLHVSANNENPIVVETRNNSFHCLTMVEGEGEITGEGWQRELKKFDTLLIPASCGRFQIEPGMHTCLDAFVPTEGFSSKINI